MGRRNKSVIRKIIGEMSKRKVVKKSIEVKKSIGKVGRKKSERKNKEKVMRKNRN